MKKTISLVLVLALGLAAQVANADFTFGTPTNLGPIVNSPVRDSRVSISSDGLELYFGSDRPGGYGDSDLYVATRPTPDDPWDEPVNLGPVVNTSARDRGARLSADGLSLFLHSNRPGGSGGVDLWVATRPSKDEAWVAPVNVGPTVNNSYGAGSPSISADGLNLYFHSARSGGFGSSDLYVAARTTIHEDWVEPINLGATVNSSASDWAPNISPDSLTLHFCSTRSGGYGSTDMWMTRRARTDDVWGTPVNLGPTVNSSAADNAPAFSADGSMLYFHSNRAGGSGDRDLWQAPIIPFVDLNGDGIVDAIDMCIMVDHWGEDYSLCDIGPMPWGDGVVDVRDLIVLAEYLFEDVNDPTLVAHWALDEIEGDIASDSANDSANDNDGIVYGDPAWQPESGVVDGALQLDGIDDYVSTPFLLNPADGKFSVFVWIKGGAPGQAVLSQIGGVNWLCADTLEGNLMTELKATGRVAAILPSEAVITDGNWHRIGLVWDGSHRTLYVDDVAVAEDAQANLEASENGLYIGTGKAMEPGTFWSGLIDDVRIYNRAVTP